MTARILRRRPGPVHEQTSSSEGPTAPVGESADALQGLVGLDDAELGARLLATVPTNENRDQALLRRWSDRACRYGSALGRDADPAQLEQIPVGERRGGLDSTPPVLATYGSREGSVTLYTDAVDLCEQLVERLGWRRLFPTGAVRRAAVAHELGHRALVGDKGLRAALGYELFHIGKLRRLGFVAGADEVAAHAFAQQLLGLPRSPLLITAAAAAPQGQTFFQGITASQSKEH